MDITDSLATYLYLATQGLYCIMDVTSTVVLLIFLSVYVFLHASQLKVAQSRLHAALTNVKFSIDSVKHKMTDLARKSASECKMHTIIALCAHM